MTVSTTSTPTLSLLYPADRTAFQYTRPGEVIRVPPITPLVIYVDQACTRLARIYRISDYALMPNSTIFTGETGLLPEFFSDEDTTRLWALVAGGEPYPLDAAYGPRLDALEATLPSGPGGANASTIRSGVGAPSDLLGLDGDWYIDKASLVIYGPKDIVWGPGTSIIGPPGKDGAPGSGGGALQSYTHQQYASSDIWDVVHPLPFTPNVMVVDSAGTQVVGDIEVLSSNHIQIKFSVPFSGTALLS